VERYFECIRSGQPYQIECRFKDRFTGGYRWFIGRALPVRNESGEIIRWFGTCTDIHEQKQLEESLREADRRKDEFLAMLGHELRNPLGVISTIVQLGQRKGSQQTEAEALWNTVAGQVKQMARLLDDLLDVSRIARGRIRLKKEPCNLTMLVHQTTQAHRLLMAESGLSLSAELTDLPLWVVGDSARLAQIVGNALSNAIKFTNVGGTVVVYLAQAQDSREAMLTIRDTGVGMEPEALAHAFEPFWQGQSSLDRSRGGLGLGLALIKGLVELHAGQVSLQSQGAGRGIELTIRLPLSQAPAEVGATLEASPKRIRPYRILVVDDNTLAAKSTERFLTQNQHTVEVATDGLTAVEAARRFHPEIVLCDIGLPNLDGYGVARLLRRDTEITQPYLIAITGYGQEQDKLRALEAGFDAHLTKPVDLTVVQKMLATLDGDKPPGAPER
jgi:signal transduction histidine kinase/ActR/RegA family two-component response regulator